MFLKYSRILSDLKVIFFHFFGREILESYIWMHMLKTTSIDLLQKCYKLNVITLRKWCRVGRCGLGQEQPRFPMGWVAEPCADAAAYSQRWIFRTWLVRNHGWHCLCNKNERVSPSAPATGSALKSDRNPLLDWGFGIEVLFDCWWTSPLLVPDLKRHEGFPGRPQHYMLKRICLSSAK